MSSFDAQDWIVRLFLRLRQRGYVLGVDEYQAALAAAKCGYAEDEDALIEMVQILWCHSRSQQSQLVTIWQTLQREVQSQDSRDDLKNRLEPEDVGSESLTEKEYAPAELEPLTQVERSPQSEVASLPVKAPFMPLEREGLLSLQNYFPVSRRSMVYGWRFLRLPVADGGKNVLDVAATIRRVTEQGYYLAPVYRRQERNGARLLLLIDQNGSMMPFHRFGRDLVETAKQESPLQPENVLVFYFQNVPSAYVYKDAYLTVPMPIQEMLEQCDRDTSVLVVSDAGAARGYRRQDRIQNTTRFLLQLRKQTSWIAWLNPMSRGRWVGSSAEILSYLVPMFQMDRFGFGEAIEAMRGLVKAAEGEGE
jgi:uncharacterized protein